MGQMEQLESMMSEQLVLFGCGGLAVEVAEYIRELRVSRRSTSAPVAVSDIVAADPGRFGDVCSILGTEPRFHTDFQTVEDLTHKRVVICVGDPVQRHRIFRGLHQAGARFGTVVHPNAWIASSAKIGSGAIVGPFSYIGPHAVVSDNCLLNVRSTIGHDAFLDTSVVISPHGDINGAARCGIATFLGAGVILDPKVSLGAYCKVASGSVVKRSFEDGFLLVGNPADGRRMFRVPDET